MTIRRARSPVPPTRPITVASGVCMRRTVAGRRCRAHDRLGTSYPRHAGGAMTGKADFTEEEWARLKRGPFVAGMAISLSDPGGPIELVKETAATVKVVTEPGDRGELVSALSTDAAADVKARHNPLADFKPKGALAGQQIVAEITAVNSIVAAKASPEDAEAYRAWLWDSARGAANAAKEGGFFGFHATLVSEGEQRMLDKLEEALTPPA